MAGTSIGIDIGHSHVRAVALAAPSGKERREGKRARLLGIASVTRRDQSGDAKPLPAVLKEVMELLHRRGHVQVHLGDAQTLVRFLSTLPLPPDRQARVIRLELASNADAKGDLAADAIPLPVPGDEVMHACIISQPQALLEGLHDLRQARIVDPAMHYGPAAAFNATIPVPPAGEHEQVLLVDIGSHATGVTLFTDQFLACRQLPLGGDAFTEALVSAGHDRRLAEQAKVDGIPLPKPKPTKSDGDSPFVDAPGFRANRPKTDELDLDDDDSVVVDMSGTRDDDGESDDSSGELVLDEDGADAGTPQLPRDDLDLPLAKLVPAGLATQRMATKVLGPELTRGAEALFAQLSSSLLWFRSQLKLDEVKPAKVLLAGGGAALVGLDSYLQRRFGVPVELFDPFAGIACGKVHAPAHPHAWTAAVGLALADRSLAGKHAILVDLRPSSLVAKDFKRHRLIWPYAAAAFLLLATLSAAIVLHRHNAALREMVAANQEFISKHGKLMKELETVQKQKDALSEDLRAIASRIYANRDMLYTVQALKEASLENKDLWVLRMETLAVGQDARKLSSDEPASETTRAEKPAGDSAIQRGKILISGKVKFNEQGKDRTDVERNEFFNRWTAYMRDWAPKDEPAAKLFKAETFDVIEWTISHKGGARTTTIGGKKSQVEEGEFPFKIALEYQPTRLSDITADRAKAAAP